MKKYLVTYHTPASAMMNMDNVSPEEMAKGMEPWIKWGEDFKDNIVEMGAPIRTLGETKDSKSYKTSKRQITGYSIVQAEDEEGVKRVFHDHTHLTWHPETSLEIHEITPMG